ncbi:hypothetical protein VUR80DRAFT_5254 [Thermomyces stellatus]
MKRQGRVILNTVLVFYCAGSAVQATVSHPGECATASLCAAKTINHITHTLPQQCLKGFGARPTSEQTPVPTDSPAYDKNHHVERLALESIATDATTPRRQQDKPILSFEEWKELMLRRHGQDPADLRERQRSEPPTPVTELADPGLSGTFGDEGEISLNFDVPAVPIPEGPGVYGPVTDGSEAFLGDDGKAHYSRSKDAGKTCKERFSYSSFDAGATVLKASPGAKNPKAILMENKDSYMLFECTAEEKYVIVELSDDILVDTVVLANFEFFSSMVRHFRVSVSDRYPVKPEKWRQLGIFEGKNARDIQPFLVENPQIWAKYVRVDFLTYYGNEYYCPVSLLRIHGTRMLESWKETEGIPEDEDSGQEPVSGGYLEATTHEDPVNIPDPHGAVSAIHDALLFGIPQATCPAPVVQREDAHPTKPDGPVQDVAGGPEETHEASVTSQHSGVKETDSPAGTYTPPNANATVPTASSTITTASPGENSRKSTSGTVDASTESTHSNSSASETPVQNKSAEPASTQPKNRTTSSSGQSALPTVQESFFKTFSKRLQLLESNMTWSLKYVEDQSRYIQEALVQIEDRRLFEAETLLASLNRTVHIELAALRQQYEEVWQSTVLALETQREQSQAELIALSSRLNVLADEVVFQKRMSIGQSTLLLCCLVLIIFSRSVAYTMPLVNWQPGFGNPFPGSQGVSRGIPGAASAGNTGNPRPPATSQDEPDSGRAGKGSMNCGPYRHRKRGFNTIGQVGLRDAYETPEETASEQVGQEVLPFHFSFGPDRAEDGGANSVDIRGAQDERKPLPPVPE